MSPDPIIRLRSLFEQEIHSHYRDCRKLLIQHLRNELTRPEINQEKITEKIEDILTIAGNHTVSSSWKNLDHIYKTGVSNVLKQLEYDGVTNLIAEYDKNDSKTTDIIIEDTKKDIGKKNIEFKAGLLKIIGKKKPVTTTIKDIQNYLINIVTPDIITQIQTASSRAYNEALYSRISRFSPYKQWIYVSDKNNAEWHKPVHETIIPVDEPFIIPPFLESKTKEIDGTEMLYPQDISKKPHALHTEDCRCYLVGVIHKPR